MIRMINFLSKGTCLPHSGWLSGVRDLRPLINCPWSCADDSSVLIPSERLQMREQNKVRKDSFRVVTFWWEILFIIL